MREKIELCDSTHVFITSQEQWKFVCVVVDGGVCDISPYHTYMSETRNSLSSSAFLYPHEAKGVKAPSEKKERKK